MTFEFDPEVAAALAHLGASGPAPTPPARGDWKTQRSIGEEVMAAFASGATPGANVAISEVSIPVAGGGVVAGVSILARDHGTPLARQILIYPMLDDRTTEVDSRLAPFATWTYDNNYTGWQALLGDDIGTDRVSPVAAPARLEEFSGLAPAFIDVGELDIFRDESIAFARNLGLSGVSVELHVRPGAPHNFDFFTEGGELGRRSMADRLRVNQAL